MGSMPLSLGLVVVLSLCDSAGLYPLQIPLPIEVVIRALFGSCILRSQCRFVSGLPYGFSPSSRCPYLLLILSFKELRDFASKCDWFLLCLLVGLNFTRRCCWFLAIRSGFTRSSFDGCLIPIVSAWICSILLGLVVLWFGLRSFRFLSFTDWVLVGIKIPLICCLAQK
jgi:hypothetical protein